MDLKKVIIGESMPDENDPKYKERAERDRQAGENFAKAVGLDKAAAFVQRFASKHTKLFLVLVFGFVLFTIGLNLYRMSQAVHYRSHPSSAVERQEGELKFNRHHAPQQNRNSQQLEIEEYRRQ